MKKVLRIGGLVLVALILVLVGAVFVLAGRFEQKLTMPDTPFPELKASTDPEVIARGEYLARTAAHCTQCHGDYPRTNPAGNTPDVVVSGGFEFNMGPIGTLYAANLTSDPETGVGQRTDRELARTLTTGVLPNGQLSIFMRYSAAQLSPEDVVAVISWLRTLPPTKKAIPPSRITTLGKAMFSMVELTPRSTAPKFVPASDEPSLARGEYLAEHVAVCVGCHTRVDMATFQNTGPKAAGGDPDPSPDEATSDMEFAPPNLTAHPTGVTGRLTEDQFVERFRAGRVFPASKMPWENFSRLSESDLRSVYRYLHSLPPIDHDGGPTWRKAGSFKDKS